MIIIDFRCSDCKKLLHQTLVEIPTNPEAILTFECERCGAKHSMTVEKYNLTRGI
jgi:DNA-directed RNA polymerase subunit RPC12/RpoP